MHRRIEDCLSELGENTELPWTPVRGGVHVSLARFPKSKSVKVRFIQDNDHIVIRSLILESKSFKRIFPAKRRDVGMATFIWETNNHNELVAIALSEEGDLIAGIRQPIASLDAEELRAYVNAVATYADRMSLVLARE